MLRSAAISLLCGVFCAGALAQGFANEDVGGLPRQKGALNEILAKSPEWTPSYFTYIFYALSFVVFVAAVFYYMESPSHTQTPDVIPAPLLLAALISLPYLFYRVVDCMYIEPIWFFFCGKIATFFWSLYLPYRVLLPVTGNMVEYSKGKGGAQLNKTIKIVVSIGTDIFLAVLFVLLTLKYGSRSTVYFIGGSISFAVVIYKALQTRQVKSKDLYGFLRKASFLLPLVTVSFFLIDLFYIGVPFYLAIHGYASLTFFLSQIWVVKISSSEN